MNKMFWARRVWRAARRLILSLKPKTNGPHVYLASREDIFHVNRLIRQIPVHEDSTFIGIIGGLGTLNYISALGPRRIVLVDINKDQVEYAECFLELIRRSPSREQLVESFFSRRYVSDSRAFLRQGGDPVLFDRTLQSMPNPESFQRFFSVIRDAPFDGDGLRIEGNSCCRSLKLTGPARGTPPGDNYLYFGDGWLSSEESYLRLRTILNTAQLSVVHSSIAELAVDWHGPCFYFHGSNVMDSFPKPHKRFLSRMYQGLWHLDADVTFIHFSTYHPVNIVRFKKFRLKGRDMHTDCAVKVSTYTRGKDVLEVVPGEHYFGRELLAGSFEVKKFKKMEVRRRYDVVVSHILYGARFLGLSRAGFEKAVEALLALADELVIVEHNSESLDFSRRRVLGLGDIADILSRLQGVEIQAEFSKGFKDDRRNVIVWLRPGAGRLI
jgi:hypothetical protein